MTQKLAGTETMQKRCKNHRAAASRTDGAVGGRPLIPFRGFSREYILQHQKMAKEAIRRKEIIINLLKSGSLTEKQLKAIVPARKPRRIFIVLVIAVMYRVIDFLYGYHMVSASGVESESESLRVLVLSRS